MSSLRVVTYFFAWGTFFKVYFLILIRKLGSLFLFLLCRVVVIPTSIVWYVTSWDKSLSGTYVGNKCGGALQP
jgi:hypothetical protein